MLRAYAITYRGEIYRTYPTEIGAKRAMTHLTKYIDYEQLFKIVELVDPSAADVRFEEIAARTGITRHGSLLAPAIAMQREALNLADLFAAVETTKQITPAQQKAINDRLAGTLHAFIAVLIELGIAPQAIINYAGGKL